ncbi:MAG: PHP domain-containing protein [Candidatus Lokiarchaeota archaeon]|nr:PHP domain-containing protein [Candidatus Lokiarchaeota archaeon]
MIDLHIHSNFSDGLDTPSQLIERTLISNKMIKAIALTDHDTIEGLAEFLSIGEKTNLITIPGIEISTKDDLERNLKDVHIVGLNIDHESIELNNALRAQLKSRIDQKKKICKRLRDEFGFNIDFQEVKSIAGGSSIGRPHIVKVLLKNNPDMTNNRSVNDLFKMIGAGGKAHVIRDFELSLEESIQLIDSSGGIPILAHPGIYEVESRSKLVEICVQAGIRGIEIEYPYEKSNPFVNTEKASWACENLPKYFSNIAEKYNLIKSGGSDYHGGNKIVQIGDADVPDAYLKQFI